MTKFIEVSKIIKGGNEMMDLTVTPAKKAEIVVAAIVGVIQAGALFFTAVGTWANWITGHEALIIAIAAPAIGLLQTFLTSAKPAKIAATVAK